MSTQEGTTIHIVYLSGDWFVSVELPDDTGGLTFVETTEGWEPEGCRDGDGVAHDRPKDALKSAHRFAVARSTPRLTPEKLTAAWAVTMKPVGNASGKCTAALPWGGQCTSLLSDGTPVHGMTFRRDVLEVLAGKTTADEVIAEWNARVESVVGVLG